MLQFLNIFAEKFSEKIGVSDSKKAKVCKKLSLHWFLRKNANYLSENCRKSPKIAENRRKSPKIAENRRKSPKIAENRRKSPKIVIITSTHDLTRNEIQNSAFPRTKSNPLIDCSRGLQGQPELTECERWCQLDDREIAAGKK
jgi:hypothetical protein